jgi:probable phosphoglycerate mutase
MLTYLLRHARTAYSSSYRLNGRPELRVALDAVGYTQCLKARAIRSWDHVVTCVVSGFPRTIQTAELLLAGRSIPIVTEARLGEIDYGVFEGGPYAEYGRWLDEHGPWQRPPGSVESQRAAILRMLDGLRDVLAWPGPRLVVAHGLLVSLIRQGTVTGVHFREAPYVTPLHLADIELRDLTARLAGEIEREPAGGTFQGRAVVSAPTRSGGLATFGHECVRNEEEDRHA